MNIRENKFLEFNNNVIKLNDVLFLHQETTGQHQFEYLIGNKIVDSKQIKVFKTNIKENEKLSRKYKFKYKHIIFPTKPTLYKSEFKEIGIEIKNIVSKEHTKMRSVYYPELVKEDYPNDGTHMNLFGLYKVQKKVFEDLKFDFKMYDKPIDNETMSLGGLSQKFDNVRRKRNSGKIVFDSIENEFERKIINSKNYIKRFSIKNALKGNTGKLDYYVNPFALNKKRVVLFGDSFFENYLDQYSILFEEVIFYRNPYVIEDFIKVLRPDIVLTGNLERYLVDVPDIMNPKPYFFKYFTTKFDPEKLEAETIQALELVFSGRDNKEFIEFKKNNECNIPLDIEDIYKITEKDIKSSVDIDICRDMAIFYEKKDIKKAYYLMEIAFNKKSSDEIIKNKYEEYKEKIN